MEPLLPLIVMNEWIGAQIHELVSRVRSMFLDHFYGWMERCGQMKLRFDILRVSTFVSQNNMKYSICFSRRILKVVHSYIVLVPVCCQNSRDLSNRGPDQSPEGVLWYLAPGC